MTLILSVAMRSAYAMQMSDRLVTSDGRAFDRQSNKTVLFHAADAIVSLSYTGPAYIGLMPTDQWIAQSLYGKAFGVLNGRVPGFTLNLSGHRVSDLGKSLDRLASATLPHIMKMSRSVGLEMAFAGWIWKRKGGHGVARPTLGSIRFDPDRRSTKDGYLISTYNRYWHFETPRPYRVEICPKGHVASDELAALVAQLSQNPSATPARDAMAELTRTVARRSSVVGADCMMVNIPTPVHRRIEVSFLPADPRSVPSIRSGTESAPATYTPWMVGPNVVLAPAIVRGASPQPLGMFEVHVSGAGEDPSSSIKSAFFSQRRPSRP